MRADTLIVGAGFTGAVLAEQLATRLGESVVVIDRRDHIAGNAYDHYDDAGVLVHRYGPHIFHTKSDRVWSYLSQFTEWHPYEHRVLADIDGEEVPVPFNFKSMDMVLAHSVTERLKEVLVAEYGPEARVPILKLRQTSDPEVRKLADFVYDKIFYGYTRKQWGFSPEELGSSVTGRVPVVVGYDDRYFDDPHQALPKHGYTKMFERILDHPRITVRLEVEFTELRGGISYDRLVFTGPIDEFFGYSLGVLPYRSLRFARAVHNQEQFQKVAQVNYPNAYEYTRITEFKHLTGQRCERTSIAYEYPEPHATGFNEPYYPIPRRENRDMYGRYAMKAEELGEAVRFAGRLADYKYYNMDQAVARALVVADSLVG